MNFRDWSAVTGTWVSISGALVGGFLGLQQYHRDVDVRAEEAAKTADARVLQTFDLFEQWQGSEMMRIRTRLTNVVHSGVSLAQLESNNDQDVFAYIDYFDAVQVCVERNLCDRGLTEELLAPPAKGSWGALVDGIALTRKAECDSGFNNERPIGYGLQVLATGHAPPTGCPQPPPPPG